MNENDEKMMMNENDEKMMMNENDEKRMNKYECCFKLYKKKSELLETVEWKNTEKKHRKKPHVTQEKAQTTLDTQCTDFRQ